MSFGALSDGSAASKPLGRKRFRSLADVDISMDAKLTTFAFLSQETQCSYVAIRAKLMYQNIVERCVFEGSFHFGR